MEILYISLVSVLVIFVHLAIPVLFSLRKSGSSSPPGKMGWPVIGESLNFLSAGWKGHPENFFLDRMAKYSSYVFSTHLFGAKTAVFCGAAGNKFLFTGENKHVELWYPKTVYSIFPYLKKKETAKLKRLHQIFLKADSLKGYIGFMDHIAQRHFSSDWENKDVVQAYPLCSNYTFFIASKSFMSIEEPTEVEKLHKPFSALATGVFSIHINLPGTPFNRAIKASRQIRKMLSEIIKQRKIDLAGGKADPTQDIMSHMLTTSDENGRFMEESDVADTILGLLFGGHESVTSLCTSIVKFLAELPEIYEGVYKEQMEIANSKATGELLNWNDIQKMKYSWNVACEVLRLAAPAQGGFREALGDVMFNGFSVSKGWKIYWSVNSTHLNSEFFNEPFKFDPTRFDGSGPAPYTFVPFGGGPRMCPGNEYARLACLVFMHNLVKRFKFEKVIGDEKIVVNPTPMPSKGLPIRLYAHKTRDGSRP